MFHNNNKEEEEEMPSIKSGCRHSKENEELHNLYSSPSIIRMMKSRRMRWAGHVALMGETRGAYRILGGKPEGKSPLGDQNVGGWTIL
jgi:hypothetical protein